MNKRIVITKADGSITIRTPAPLDRRPDETEEAFLARCMAAPVRRGTVTGMTVVDAAEIPPDIDTYRNAWTFDGSKIAYDMTKAKNIHRDLVREARGALLSLADVAVSQALVKGDAKAVKDAEAERQRLRDATADPRIDAAKTIAELKAVWPL